MGSVDEESITHRWIDELSCLSSKTSDTVPTMDRREGASPARPVLVTTMLVARSMTELISDHVCKGGHDDCQQELCD
jgi:hypothetical protein